MNNIESYVTCSFNASHRILKARYQWHLFKCSRNYPRHMRNFCPFDTTHRVIPEEFDHHLRECPSSGNVLCYQNVLGSSQPVGTVSIEDAGNLETPVDETDDWSGNHVSYNPLAASEKKKVLRIPIAMSKSEKKKFKEYERQRLLSLENDENNKYNNAETPVQKKQPEGPLRFPKHASKAESHDATINNSILSTNNSILRMQNISIDESNDTSVDKDTSKLNNSISKKDNNKTALTDTLVNDIGNLSIHKNNSQIEQNENISTKEIHTTTPEKRDLQINNILPKLIKHHTLEQQKQVGLNNVQNGVLYGEPRKVSTGRGFILAHQHFNSNTSTKPEPKKLRAPNTTSDFEDN